MVDTKMCANPECRRVLPLTAFYRRASSPDGRQSWCKRCSRANRAQWAADNPERLRGLNQLAARRRMADPERAAVERVRKREWERRDRGTLPENYRTSKYMREESPSYALLPVAPFAAWVQMVLERDSTTVVDLAARFGVHERRLRDILKGRTVDVELATVERALIADGTTILDEIYPLEDAA